MDFHQLQYFVAIAESGSITAAAKKLFLSQPPLSMQMKRLEKELGCVLFLRGAREVQLTEAGKLLYTRAKSMLELRRITEEELAVCSEQTSGTIRLGVISSVGCSLLPQWLKWFHAQYPQIRFSLYESDTYQILEKLRTMDVSITYKAILTPTNRHWTVFQLYDELHREHCAMTGKEQDDSK